MGNRFQYALLLKPLLWNPSGVLDRHAVTTVLLQQTSGQEHDLSSPDVRHIYSANFSACNAFFARVGNIDLTVDKAFQSSFLFKILLLKGYFVSFHGHLLKLFCISLWLKQVLWWQRNREGQHWPLFAISLIIQTDWTQVKTHANVTMINVFSVGDTKCIKPLPVVCWAWSFFPDSHFEEETETLWLSVRWIWKDWSEINDLLFS